MDSLDYDDYNDEAVNLAGAPADFLFAQANDHNVGGSSFDSEDSFDSESSLDNVGLDADAGTVLAVGDQGSVLGWDLDAKKLVRRVPRPRPSGMPMRLARLSRDGAGVFWAGAAEPGGCCM